MSKEKLLKEYVKGVILSEDFGGFDGGMGGMYGMDFTGGDQSKLAKVFLTPFTDVVKTAAGQGKEVSQKAQTAVKVAYETVMTTLIPVLSSDYDQIFEKEKANIDKIRSQYKDVYDRTWTALTDNDVLAAAFAYDPARMITNTLARKAPGPILDTINVLAGGNLDNFVSKVKKFLKGGDEKKMLDTDRGGAFQEGIIREEKGKRIDIGKVLTQPKIKDKIEANPNTREMQKQAQAATRQSLETLFDRLRAINSSKSIEDLERKTGAQFDQNKIIQNTPEELRKGMEEKILTGMKKSAQELYSANLESTVKKAIDAGVPEDHPYIADYKKAISKIKSL